MRTHRKPEQTLPVIFPYTGGVFFFPFSPIQNTPTVRSISALFFFPPYISLHLYGRFSLFPIFHRTYHFICTVDFRSLPLSTVQISLHLYGRFSLFPIFNRTYHSICTVVFRPFLFSTVQISPFVRSFFALSYFRPYILLHLYGRFSLFPIFDRTGLSICTVVFRPFLFSTVPIHRTLCSQHI